MVGFSKNYFETPFIYSYKDVIGKKWQKKTSFPDMIDVVCEKNFPILSS